MLLAMTRPQATERPSRCGSCASAVL